MSCNIMHSHSAVNLWGRNLMPVFSWKGKEREGRPPLLLLQIGSVDMGGPVLFQIWEPLLLGRWEVGAQGWRKVEFSGAACLGKPPNASSFCQP